MVNMFSKEFEKLATTHDVSIVFNDFLDYSIDQFLINPNVKYFNHSRYSKEEYEIFYNLISIWITRTEKELETHKWFDYLGLIYEEIIQSKYKAGARGQFFTPSAVCDMLAQTTYSSEKYQNNDEVLSVYDSACGSARTLLSWHTLRPQDILYGADLDEVSCKMTILNFLIHGVKGSISHMNSLSLEWFKGWKINEFINHGQPFTIMECASENECFIWFGENKFCFKSW